jgi:hypothetical protein
MKKGLVDVTKPFKSDVNWRHSTSGGSDAGTLPESLEAS